jgi:hypothetical protein
MDLLPYFNTPLCRVFPMVHLGGGDSRWSGPLMDRVLSQFEIVPLYEEGKEIDSLYSPLSQPSGP